jgi:hypothetical protein
MMHVSRFVPALVVLTLSAGCGGGQTGDLSGENDTHGHNTGSSNGCDDQLTQIGRDDASALGFDAASVLSFAERSFQTDLAWQAVEHVQYSPSASASQLTLTLRSRDLAWLVHSTPAKSSDSQGGTLIEVSCPPDRLRIAVHAELQSADGALAESFDSSLEARSRYVATLSREIVAEQLSGSFEIIDVTPPDILAGGTAKVQNLGFQALLTPGGMAGALNGQVSSQNAQVAGASMVTFARFPGDSRCAVNPGSTVQSVPVGADDAALGQTGADALSEVNAWGAIPLTWADGASGELRLELSELGDGCVQVAGASGYFDPALPAATVVYPVELKATTTDGRLQGQYAASLVTWPKADGSGFSQRVEVNRTFAANALSATGFSGVSVPSGTQRLGVRLESLFDAASASGKVVLEAQKDPPCVTDPEPPSANSVPGCAGTSVTPLLGATW